MNKGMARRQVRDLPRISTAKPWGHDDRLRETQPRALITHNMLNHFLRITLATVALVTIFSLPVAAQSSPAKASGQLPAWVKDVGARRAPSKRRVFLVNIAGDAAANSTK